MGNAAYHSDSLYTVLSPAVPLLVDLLSDSVARTRANAAGKELAELVTGLKDPSQPCLCFFGEITTIQYEKQPN